MLRLLSRCRWGRASRIHTGAAAGARGRGLEHPVVERAVRHELRRAQAVADAFEVVAQAVRVVVQRVDAPLVAGMVMRDVADAVEQGSRSHILGEAMSILLRSERAPSGNSPAFIRWNKSRFSATEQCGRRELPGLSGAPRYFSVSSGREVAHVRLAALDQLDREFVERVEVVAGEEGLGGGGRS